MLNIFKNVPIYAKNANNNNLYVLNAQVKIENYPISAIVKMDF